MLYRKSGFEKLVLLCFQVYTELGLRDSRTALKALELCSVPGATEGI